jgi:Tfp pilus assembly protein PilW
MIAGVVIALLIAAGIISALYFHMRNRKKASQSLLKNHDSGFEEVRITFSALSRREKLLTSFL